MKVELIYREHRLDDVLEAWAKGFRPLKRNEHIKRKEWFVDISKGTVIFRLTIQSDRKSK